MRAGWQAAAGLVAAGTGLGVEGEAAAGGGGQPGRLRRPSALGPLHPPGRGGPLRGLELPRRSASAWDEV